MGRGRKEYRIIKLGIEGFGAWDIPVDSTTLRDFHEKGEISYIWPVC